MRELRRDSNFLEQEKYKDKLTCNTYLFITLHIVYTIYYCIYNMLKLYCILFINQLIVTQIH